METTIRTNTSNKVENSKTKNQTTTHSSFWDSLEFNRFGIMPIVLLIIGCVGGIAASFGAGTDVIKLSVIAFPTIIALAFMLAVAPMRVIIWTSAIAVVLDLLVIIF
jgi:hypothetical protein